MESLLDEVDSLIAPGLSTDTPEWCSNCQSLRQEIKGLQEEQLQNFGKLKQKIISTDLLIKKYKSKCDDYDLQCKKTEEANKRTDKFQRQCEILETQLKAALLDTEPLRKTKMMLEAEIRLKNVEIQSISDRLLAAEGAQKQYEHLTKASSNDIDKLEGDKRELLAKIKTLESGKLSKEASKEYKHEISALKKEKAAMLKNEKRLESKLSGALAKIEHLTNIMKEKKLSPKRRRRTSSGNRSSPLKSPVRSPRGEHKASPMIRGRARTVSERSAASLNTEGAPALSVEKLASCSESSSDDTDDAGSLCSVAWTFSPIMKCLSPLPPSPACFKDRKLKKSQQAVERDEEAEEEEAEVSDIADELEQQLLQDDKQEEASERDGTKNDSFETIENTEQSCSSKKATVDDIKNSKEDSCKDTDDIKEEIKSELNKTDQKVEENVNCHLSVKEKLAHSIDIVSPTAVRKRMAHQPNRTKCSLSHVGSIEHGNKAAFESVKNSDSKTDRTPPVRRSSRIRSVTENEISESELDVSETKQNGNADTSKQKSEKSELNRNDTEEFKPVMSEFTETLSDSEMEEEVENIEKSVSKAKPDICDDTATAVDHSITKSDVPSLDNTGQSEINVNKTHKQHFNASSNEIKTVNTEGHVENREEEQKVKMSQMTVTKSCLQRQEVVNEEPTKILKDIGILKGKVDHKNDKGKGRSKFSSDKFINFQKSSSGTLSNEIEDFSYVDDYKVLTRDDKESKMLSPKTEIKPCAKKNLKRRMKRSCKYRDRDSESYRNVRDIVSDDHSDDIGAQLSDIFSDIEKVKEEHKEMQMAVEENLKHPKEMLNGENKDKVIAQTETSKDLKLNTQSQETEILDGISSEIRTKQSSPKENISEANNDLQVERKSVGNHKPELAVKDTTESKTESNKSGYASKLNENKGEILKESKDNETDTKLLNHKDFSDVTLQLETNDLASFVEKVTPSRQMSTGFTLHTPTLERASSTESTFSFRNSPSRLFHLESGLCDTIVEEEIGEEEVDKDDKIRNSDNRCESKNNHDAGVIFGVEDLLDVGNDSDSLSVQSAQNAMKPFCDKTSSADNIENMVKDKTKSESDALSIEALDEEYNRPGCSYHYNDSSDLSTSHEVSAITCAVKRVVVPQEDENSLSRSSTSSIASINRASPVSPLSISPFNFLDPLSPLPPSPVRNMERVSPLSPEQLSGEPELKLEVDEPEVCKDTGKENPVNIVKDTVNVDLSNKEACTEKQKSFVDKNQNLQNEELNVERKKETESKKLENNNDQTVNKLRCLNKAKGKKMKVKKTQSIVKSAEFNIDSLELFSLSHMISPVKTPKRKVKLKVEQMKTLENENQCTKGDGDKSQTFNVVKNQEETVSKPKQFSTKAPESAIAVKPRLTRSMGSLEMSDAGVCVRKSSRSAIRRIDPTNNADATTAKKVSVDGTSAFEVKGTHSKTATERTDFDNLKDTDTIVALDNGICKNVEEQKIKNEVSNELKNMDDTDKAVDEMGDNKATQEWEAGQDNLAFKRKTRVAHKPNIHTLKPQKIQIIEAPRLLPVSVGRKRKCVDNTTSKESHDKKQCKENTFKKQKSAPTDSGVKGAYSKKMQAFLKSTESPESFVTRLSTEVSTDDIDLQLLDSCFECIGRIRTDTLEVVYGACESGQYLMIRDQFPFLSDVEKKALQLIQYLWTKQKIDTAVVMKKIWNCVFSRDISAMVVGKMAQCRVFVALCSIQGDLELARTLFYHLVTCGHMNSTQFIVSVVSVWPDVLKKDPSDLPDKVVSHGMTLVLEEIVTKTLLSQQAGASSKILVILRKLCNWSGISGDASCILKLLCNRMMSILAEESVDKSEFELTKALELLCTNQSWAWFKEQFIMRHGLQTVTNKYLAEKMNKPVPPDYVCAILRLTSRCMSSLSASVKSRDYQLIIKNWLLPMLSHKPGNEKVRQCCLETLLELSPLYITCLDSIQKWFVEEKDGVSQELVTRMEELRLHYKQKFGLQCKPFIKM